MKKIWFKVSKSVVLVLKVVSRTGEVCCHWRKIQLRENQSMWVLLRTFRSVTCFAENANGGQKG